MKKNPVQAILLFCMFLLLTACGGGSGKANENPAVSNSAVTATTNVAPSASAGSNQSVSVNQLLVLDGSASSDANKDKLTYSWTLTMQPAGSTAALSSADTVHPSFTPDVEGRYIVSLTVNDGKSNSLPSIVMIDAKIPPGSSVPVARAGATQNVKLRMVYLDGSASSDADGDMLTYRWTMISKPNASQASLSSTTAVKPEFNADVVGNYVITLVVNDGKFDSTPSTVNITTSSVNFAPVANAGVAQNTLLGPVTLNGSASSDADGDPLTYAWIMTSRPAGSRASLSSTTLVNPSFIADVTGEYIFALIVNDGQLSSAPATVTVTASSSNVAPVANAGPAQNVKLGPVSLNGSASSDANGDQLTYVWTMLSRPAGSKADLSSATLVNPGFTADVAGTYVFSLVVNDGRLNSAAATVMVTASSGNVAPVANAGPAQNTKLGLVTLNGGASYDADGNTLTYSWSLQSRPVGSSASVINASSINPSFIADVAGTYVMALIVKNGKLASTTSTVIITASSGNVAPVANAGSAQTVTTGTVNLDGSGSYDADGDALSYSWVMTAKPAGSSASLVNPTTKKPNFVADIAGSYVAALTVNDGKLSSTAVSVTITVTAAPPLAVALSDILVYANPNVATPPTWGRVQCMANNYWMKDLSGPIMGTDGSTGTEAKYEIQNSGDRKAYYFSARETDPDTAGAGVKRCQQVFFQPEQAIPLDEPFWYGIDIATSDMGNSVDEQLLWQWHINKNDANGQPIQLSPYLAVVIGGNKSMVVNLTYNRNQVLDQNTLTKKVVYSTNTWTPNVFHRFIVKAYNSRTDNSSSYVKVWLDGVLIVNYTGQFGFNYSSPPSDVIIHGMYHWTVGNTWDATVPKRSSWIRGVALLRDRTGYTPESISSLLDSKSISK